MGRCPRCGSDNPSGARFCNSCGASLGEDAPGREERKVVTVLFADLVGFTGRSERLDPEDVRSILREFHARLRTLLESYGGTVEKFIGDEVMAVFGAPVAHEDDPERAVRAGLAIRDAMEDEELDVRIGVNTGETLVALEARPGEGEAMVAGDAVNTAARIRSAAPIGGVLVGEITHRATDQAIEYRDAAPITAKGKTDPLPVWEAVAPRSRLGVDVDQSPATELIGRERELALIRDTFARVRAERETQLVTLVGVPGIGKTRLVFELLQDVRREPELIYWRQGRSLPYGEGLPFWAVAEMVKAQAGVLDTDDSVTAERKLAEAVRALAPDEAHAIEPPLRALLGLESAAQALEDAFAAWRRFFEAMAEQRPLVLVVEDLHWADELLLDFVEHLADWMRGVPVLVLGTARPELLERRPAWGGGKLNALTLALSPLSDDDTARLLAALLERALLPAETQATLLAHAAGNPLYAEQFARMLGEGGTTEVPETVQGIIAARLDGLSPREKELLQDAAVVGKVFWPGALDAPDAERVLHGLERKEFVRHERRSSIEGQTEFAFRHVLLRDVAYSQIPRAIRAEKHRSVGGWLEALSNRDGDLIEMVAHHHASALELARASGTERPELVESARLALYAAGRKAWGLQAFAASAGYLEGALELWPADDQRPLLEFRALRSGHLLRAVLTSEQVERFRQVCDALREVGDVEHAVEAQLVLAERASHDADRARCRALIEEGLGWLSGRGPSMAQAYAHGQLAGNAMMASEYSRAIEFARTAGRIAETVGGPDDFIAAMKGFAGTSRLNGGDFAGCAELEEAVEMLRRAGSHRLSLFASNTGAAWAETAGDVRRAIPYDEEGLDAALRFGMPWAVHNATCQLVSVRYWLGRWDEALELARQVSESRADAPTYNVPFVRIFRARILAARGAVDEAVRELRTAVDEARAIEDPQILFPVLALAARMEVTSFDEALAFWAERGFGSAAYALVDIAAGALRAGRGAEVLTIAANRAHPSRWQQAATACAAGEWPVAAALFDEIGSLPDAAWAYRHAGEPERSRAFYRSVGSRGSWRGRRDRVARLGTMHAPPVLLGDIRLRGVELSFRMPPAA